jgi:hypothetical protein
MSELELDLSSEYKTLIKKVEALPIESKAHVKLAGKLGEEGPTFLKLPSVEHIQTDLKQALHIHNFIQNSIQSLKTSFKSREYEMFKEFCDDQKIFQELEEKNQLDIKGDSY